MSFRIGFDVDGVLADLAGAYRAIEERLFGPGDTADGEEHGARDSSGEDIAETFSSRTNAVNDAHTTRKELTALRGRRDAIWRAIKDTRDFWTTLAPTDPAAVRRIQEMALRHQWDVVFITQRPATAGDTVQRQTQRWLAEHGFEFPSVVALDGSRGAVAGALRLDYLVDDTPMNCVDVKSESGARLILVTDTDNDVTVRAARRLGITVAPSISAALDLLETASLESSAMRLRD